MGADSRRPRDTVKMFSEAGRQITLEITTRGPIKNSRKLKFREGIKSNMLSQFQILLKKNSGQENLGMVS